MMWNIYVHAATPHLGWGRKSYVSNHLDKVEDLKNPKPGFQEQAEMLG